MNFRNIAIKRRHALLEYLLHIPLTFLKLCFELLLVLHKPLHCFFSSLSNSTQILLLESSFRLLSLGNFVLHEAVGHRAESLNFVVKPLLSLQTLHLNTVLPEILLHVELRLFLLLLFFVFVQVEVISEINSRSSFIPKLKSICLLTLQLTQLLVFCVSKGIDFFAEA